MKVRSLLLVVNVFVEQETPAFTPRTRQIRTIVARLTCPNVTDGAFSLPSSGLFLVHCRAQRRRKSILDVSVAIPAHGGPLISADFIGKWFSLICGLSASPTMILGVSDLVMKGEERAGMTY